ncbi:hypothetical protein KAR91_85960, partial [Candidatus Pacearchaeota archaeon]|nr:hypothetical protein [Candidatus Pacearchaeota archaeon]
MNNIYTRADSSLQQIFNSKYDLPFILLLTQLIFSRLRPDRLLPGGEILTHFPTILAGLLIICWLTAKPKILHNPQTKLFILFVLMMCLHVPFARNAGYAYHLASSFFFFAIPAFLIKIQFIDTFFKLDKYIRIFFIFSLFFAVLGIMGSGKINIPVLHDENDFCLFINVLIPFGFFLGMEAKTTKKKIFYYGTLVIFTLAIIASFSRGGVIGFVAVCMFLFWKSKRKTTLIVLGCMMAFAAYWFAP